MRLALFSLLFILLPLTPVRSAQTDTGIWATTNLARPVAQHWLADLLVQSRMLEAGDRLERFLFRPSVTHLFDKRLSATFGYDAHFIKIGSDITEQRLWQQIQYSENRYDINPIFRFRIEQRYFDGLDEMSLRGRWLLGITVPTGMSWLSHAIVRDEIFFNINDVNPGLQRGFEQNRLFAGFATPLQRGFAVELGYQHQYINRSGIEDLSIHQLYLAISKRFED